MPDPHLIEAVHHFPLVQWARPACPPLAERIANLTAQAEATASQPDHAPDQAATVLNLAALIASDCGRPDLAADLCWQHIDTYRLAGRELTAAQTMRMLGSLANLARLRARAGHIDKSLTLLRDLLHATRTRTDLTIDGRTIPLSAVIADHDARRRMVQWCWMQLLTDGIKTLARAGRWAEAADLARVHRGIGNHLLEGRQATIIALLLGGDRLAARQVLADSTLTRPWEHQVASCLAVLCATPAEAAQAIETMIAASRHPAATPQHIYYRARLAVTVTVLAQRRAPTLSIEVFRRAAAEVITAGDGYAAREILAHQSARDILTKHDDQQLANVVIGSGLIGDHPLTELLSAAASVLHWTRPS